MKKLQYLFMSLAAMLLATPAFAQGAGATASNQWVPLAAGLGMALAAGLCGLGQGKATASATEALARNPGARPGIFIFLILGLAFIESLALFTFVLLFFARAKALTYLQCKKASAIAGAFCFGGRFRELLRGRGLVLWRGRERGRHGARFRARWCRWGAGWRRQSWRRVESAG